MLTKASRVAAPGVSGAEKPPVPAAREGGPKEGMDEGDRGLEFSPGT